MKKINSAKNLDEFRSLNKKTVTKAEFEKTKAYFNCTICQEFDQPHPFLSDYLKRQEFVLVAWFCGEAETISVFIERETPLNTDDFVFQIGKIFEKALKQHERLCAFRILYENGEELGGKSYASFYNRGLDDHHFTAVFGADLKSHMASNSSPLIIVSMDGYETVESAKDFIINNWFLKSNVKIANAVNMDAVIKEFGGKELFSSDWERFTFFENKEV